jgi:hypothetical protein
MADDWDEEKLVSELREVFATQQEVPTKVVEAGKRIFDWHYVDKELAQLSYDSTRESDRQLATRAEGAAVHALTFSSAHLAVELEFTADAVLGQVVPPQVTTVTMQLDNGRESGLAADEIGCFSIRPAPPGTFRLRCQTAAGLDVLTAWITGQAGPPPP